MKSKSPLKIPEGRGTVFRVILSSVILALAGWMLYFATTGFLKGEMYLGSRFGHGRTFYRATSPGGFWLATIIDLGVCVLLGTQAVRELIYTAKRREGIDYDPTEARKQKSAAHLLLLPVAFGIMAAASYVEVRIACAIGSMAHPEIQSFSSYHEATKTLIVIPALFASIPAGFIAANLLVYLIPPIRRFFDQEARDRNGEVFPEAMKGLIKIAMYGMPPLIAVSVAAALFGR